MFHLDDVLMAASGAGGWKLGDWLLARWDTHRAPLFVTWREAREWAMAHPGRLARSVDGATVRAGVKR